MDEQEYAKQVTIDLYQYLPFLRDRWQEFCAMVEKNAEQLAHYQAEHWKQQEKKIRQHLSAEPQREQVVQALDAITQRKNKLVEKGWVIWSWEDDTDYLDLPDFLVGEDSDFFETCNRFRDDPVHFVDSAERRLALRKTLREFCAPSEVVNPVLWLLGGQNPREPNDTKGEPRLCNYAILCLTYDNNIFPDEQHICTHDTYKGKYFLRDEFCYGVRKWQWPADRLQRAFKRAKPDLNAWLTSQKPPPPLEVPQSDGANRQKAETKKQEVETAVTLVEFMQTCCQGEFTRAHLTTLKDNLLKAARRKDKPIKLPPRLDPGGPRRKAKFAPADLKKVWPKLVKDNPSLPDLKHINK